MICQQKISFFKLSKGNKAWDEEYEKFNLQFVFFPLKYTVFLKKCETFAVNLIILCFCTDMLVEAFSHML